MAVSTLLLLGLLLPQTPDAVPAPASVPRPRAELPLLVLAPPEESAFAAFQLGDGGVELARTAPPAASPGDATTPGGVRVQARTEGVKLTFASGRELLFARTGFLHLRDEAQTGPFPDGVELRLADGSAVRIVHSNGRRLLVDEVVLAVDGREERLYGDGRPQLVSQRSKLWDGPRLLCAGDGGAVYRAIALGPLIVAERVLAPKASEDTLPAHRLTLFTAPLAQSLQAFAARRRGTSPELQKALAALGEVAVAAPRLFSVPANRPFRVGRGEPCWSLTTGCQLRLETRDNQPVRLGLHLGDTETPLVEWSLGLRNELRMLNPVQDGKATSLRYVQGGVELPVVSPALQARPESRELVEAVRMLRAALK